MSDGRFFVGLLKVNTNEGILAIKSLPKVSVSSWQEDIYTVSSHDLALLQLNRELNDISTELEKCSFGSKRNKSCV